eukprot:COSAG01_NODE_23558_length_810_cov_6.426160_1_plen_190_part_00
MRGTWLHIIVRGTAAFADAAAARAPNLEVATRAPRSTPAATFQRLGSGRSPSGAPHGGERGVGWAVHGSDTIAKELRNNPGDKQYRDSIIAILLAHERQYGSNSSGNSGSRQPHAAENGQHASGNSNKRFANYVPPKNRGKGYYDQKKFGNPDQRDAHHGIFKDNKRCCDAQGKRYCGHSQLDDTARNH